MNRGMRKAVVDQPLLQFFQYAHPPAPRTPNVASPASGRAGLAELFPKGNPLSSLTCFLTRPTMYAKAGFSPGPGTTVSHYRVVEKQVCRVEHV
jgi:hypothetical protein